jgi:hypothetical protein
MAGWRPLSSEGAFGGQWESLLWAERAAVRKATWKMSDSIQTLRLGMWRTRKTPLARICQRARGGSDRTFGELGAGDPPRPPSISSLSDSMICFRTKSRRG